MENNNNEFMGDVFKTDNSKDKNDLDVLKELFEAKDITTKTELNPKEIIEINKKMAVCKLMQWDTLHNIIHHYMELKVSLMRKGRAEFVDGFKAERGREADVNKGAVSKMLGL